MTCSCCTLFCMFFNYIKGKLHLMLRLSVLCLTLIIDTVFYLIHGNYGVFKKGVMTFQFLEN
jgi:hypothetical protein